MRCKNCGYVNEDSVQRCIKCNAELGGADPGPSFNTRSSARSNDAFQPAATISEATGGGFRVGGGASESTPDRVRTVAHRDFNNGGTQMNAGGAGRRRPEPPQGEAPAPEARPASQPFSGTLPPGRPISGKGTINPWNRPVGEASCYLCHLDGVAQGSASDLSHRVVICKGDGFELTRDNTVPFDNTISSHQAILTHDADGWYIEDKSTYHTTAIIASRRMRLEEGDTVVLGSSRFVFTENKPTQLT